MAKRRVVLTGAAGYISAQLLPVLHERYDLVLLDLTKETKGGGSTRSKKSIFPVPMSTSTESTSAVLMPSSTTLGTPMAKA